MSNKHQNRTANGGKTSGGQPLPNPRAARRRSRLGDGRSELEDRDSEPPSPNSKSPDGCKDLFDNAPVGFHQLDAEGRFVRINQTGLEMLGYTAEELLGQFVWNISGEPEQTRRAVLAKLSGALPASPGFERQLRRKDGTTFPVLINEQLVKRADGAITGICSGVQDITELKRTEEKLKLFRALIESSADAIYVMDPATGRFLDVNESACRAFGCTRAEHLALTVFDLVAGLDRARFDASLAQARQAGHLTLETQHRRRDGTVFPVEVSLSSITLDREYLLADMRDITDRKRAEEAAAGSRNFLDQIINAVPNPIFVKDRQHRGVLVNDAFCRLMGLRREDLIGKSDHDHAFLTPAQADVFRARDELVFTTGREDINEETITASDGALRHLITKKALYTDETGAQFIVGIISDITERKRAEQALSESRSLYQSLVNQTPAGIFRKDREGRFVFVNPVFCQLKGMDAEEILGKTPREVDDYERAKEAAGLLKTPPRQRTLANQGAEHHELILRTGQRIEVEEIYPQPDGTVEYFDVVKSPVFDADGRIIGTQGIQFDVTERKRAEQALQLFQFATDRAADAVFWINRDGSFHYVNDEACRSLGYTRAELLRLRLFDIDPDFTEAQWDANWLLYANTEIAIHRLESTHRRKDGTRLPVEIVTRHFSTGGVDVRVAFVRDITERRRVAETQARLATAVEQAAETIVITDLHGIILYVNPAFERTSGYAAAEAVGQHVRLLKSGRHDAEFYRRLWQVLASGNTWAGHFINRRKDGALYEEEATISPVRDAAGAIVNYVAAKRDVTREKQLEAQMHQAQKMEAIGQLAGGVAHDFNNILSVIIGYSEMIAADLDPDNPLRSYAEELREAANRATGLTRQLLVFSRKQKVQPVVLDLNATVKDLDKMLRRLIGENIEMKVIPGAQIGHILADPGHIGQVLMNLVVNARDAMPNGGRLTIATRNITLSPSTPSPAGQKMGKGEDGRGRGSNINVTCDKGQVASDTKEGSCHLSHDTLTVQGHMSPVTLTGDFVMLSVSDTGIGMTPEVKARLFEALFTTKPAGKGTGLGLATCQTIIQQCGGFIDVESEAGAGATFRIYFPRVDKPLEEAAPTQTAALPRGTETVLLVEDEPSVKNLAANVLTALGYNVLRANNGQDALHLFREHKGPPVRLVVTDVVMPRMGGKVMADWLKTADPDLKIIFTSGYTDDAITQQGVLEPGVVFLPKPYTPEVLARKVRALLDSSPNKP